MWLQLLMCPQWGQSVPFSAWGRGPGRDLNECCAGRGTTVSWSLSAQGNLSHPQATSTKSLSRRLEVTHANPRPWRQSVNASDEGGGEEGDSEGAKDVM